jgi:hypothetical protein
MEFPSQFTLKGCNEVTVMSITEPVVFDGCGMSSIRDGETQIGWLRAHLMEQDTDPNHGIIKTSSHGVGSRRRRVEFDHPASVSQ